MEYSITNIGDENKNDLFTVRHPIGVVDPVTNRCTYGWECISLPTGSYYSTPTAIGYSGYFVYDASTNTVQYLKYGSVCLDASGITTNDFVTVTLRERSQGTTFIRTYRCPVKFANEKKLTFEMSSKIYPIHNIERELRIGNGSCIVQRRIFFEYDEPLLFDEC